MNVLLIWLFCLLFNLLKINQSFSKEWRSEYQGVYWFATILAPFFTIGAFLVVFIFNSWKTKFN